MRQCVIAVVRARLETEAPARVGSIERALLPPDLERALLPPDLVTALERRVTALERRITERRRANRKAAEIGEAQLLLVG